MKIFRFAAILAASSCLVVTTDAIAHMQGGHMSGGVRSSGAPVATHAHGMRSGSPRHDGRFFHGRRFASSFVVVGGIWYPWYTYAAPPYTSAGYAYYCPSLGAYYPDVTTCPEPWVPVAP